MRRTVIKRIVATKAINTALCIAELKCQRSNAQMILNSTRLRRVKPATEIFDDLIRVVSSILNFQQAILKFNIRIFFVAGVRSVLDSALFSRVSTKNYYLLFLKR